MATSKPSITRKALTAAPKSKGAPAYEVKPATPKPNAVKAVLRSFTKRGRE